MHNLIIIMLDGLGKFLTVVLLRHTVITDNSLCQLLIIVMSDVFASQSHHCFCELFLDDLYLLGFLNHVQCTMYLLECVCSAC